VDLVVVGITVGQVERLLEALVGLVEGFHESFEVGKVVGFMEGLEVVLVVEEMGFVDGSSEGLREGCVGARRTPMG